MGDAAMFETVNALTADYRARITELEAVLAKLDAALAQSAPVKAGG